MSDVLGAGNTSKAQWVEPKIEMLDIAETAALPRRGVDGSVHLDCTRS